MAVSWLYGLLNCPANQIGQKIWRPRQVGLCWAAKTGCIIAWPLYWSVWPFSGKLWTLYWYSLAILLVRNTDFNGTVWRLIKLIKFAVAFASIGNGIGIGLQSEIYHLASVGFHGLLNCLVDQVGCCLGQSAHSRNRNLAEKRLYSFLRYPSEI